MLLEIYKTLFWPSKNKTTTTTHIYRPGLQMSYWVVTRPWGDAVVNYTRISNIYKTKGSVSPWGKCQARSLGWEATLHAPGILHIHLSWLISSSSGSADEGLFPAAMIAFGFQDSPRFRLISYVFHLLAVLTFTPKFGNVGKCQGAGLHLLSSLFILTSVQLSHSLVVLSAIYVPRLCIFVFPTQFSFLNCRLVYPSFMSSLVQ